jgi:hypothetical protein
LFRAFAASARLGAKARKSGDQHSLFQLQLQLGRFGKASVVLPPDLQVANATCFSVWEEQIRAIASLRGHF